MIAREIMVLDGKVSMEDMKGAARKRRELDRKLDSLGIIPKRVFKAEDFPTGTDEAARASGEVWTMLESAMSLMAAVNGAEMAVIAATHAVSEREA